LPIFPQTIDMEFDRLTDEPQHFFARWRGSDATREVGNVSTERLGTFFDDN